MGCFLDEIPCEDCICLAICQNRMELSCSILYKWFRKGDQDIRLDLIRKKLPKWVTIEVIKED
jgi:hypothetical protein